MSELKDYDIMDIEAMDDERLEKSESGKIQVTRVYIKADADKVIAEKDEEIDELKESIDELQKATDSAWSKVNAMFDELRHSNHKRCLAMAEWCQARYDEEDAKVNGHYSSWEYINIEMKYWERWRWRWEELAEEPTWAKFLQLIHKEVK